MTSEVGGHSRADPAVLLGGSPQCNRAVLGVSLSSLLKPLLMTMPSQFRVTSGVCSPPLMTQLLASAS